MGISTIFGDDHHDQTSDFGNSQPRFSESGEHFLGRSNPGISSREEKLFDLQRKVQSALVAEMESRKMDLSQPNSQAPKQFAQEHLNRLIEQEAQKQAILLSPSERANLVRLCLSDIHGYGPIDPLLQDEAISEIMINGPRDVYVLRNNKTIKTNIHFNNNDHLMRMIDRIVSQVGRRVDESSPMVDARLVDRSRVNVILPPISLVGPVVTIRKFRKRPLQPQDLVDNGTISAEMLLFLEACVRSRLNIIVSGGTGTGKTSLLNVLSVFIQQDQRIITIEDAAELQLQQDHVIALESRPANVEGKNQVSIRQLVANSLRMKPDRIIVGECRGGEALDMLQAMNTGHEGSMTTVHANSARDVINRLETLTLLAGVELPERAIREQIASAIHLIVHLGHYEGVRRVASISEIRRGGNDAIQVVDIFEFTRTGVDQRGNVVGRLRATGERPNVLERLDLHNVSLPPTIFQR